ncbi:hypothetical protein ACL02U_31455 [Streptomyces sp. MS06]|uniref:hypothetical protein n=1 Tax=Streptomyces sp. MS06 TaxID=3385974 RepID=UPI0039A0B929
MAWDEWEQLKAEAADRHTARMQIDHVAPVEDNSGTSSVTGGVKSTKKAWISAGEGVHTQREALDNVTGRLSDGQKSLGEDEGCQTAVAQRKVYGSWNQYAHGLATKCDALQKVLEQTGHDLLLTDDSVKTALNQINTEFKDTPAVGGHGGDR